MMNYDIVQLLGGDLFVGVLVFGFGIIITSLGLVLLGGGGWGIYQVIKRTG